MINEGAGSGQAIAGGEDFEAAYESHLSAQIKTEKLDEIRSASLYLSHSLAEVQGRCPLCTLKPPCKHTTVHADLQSNGKQMSFAERAAEGGQVQRGKNSQG